MSETPWRDPDGVWIADPNSVLLLMDVESHGGANVLTSSGQSITVIRMDVVVQVGDDRSDRVMHLMFPREMVPDLMRSIRLADQFVAEHPGPVA
jgi:hypothetical protein